MRTIFNALLIASVLTIAVRVQDLGTRAGPAFEIASVKRSTVAYPMRAGFIPTPGRFVAESVPAESLIGFAYRDSATEVKGAPDWARSRSELYNVTAIVPPQSSSSDVMLMVRRLLVDRFRLVAHVEQQERDALALVRREPDGPLAAGLQRIDEDCAGPRQPATPVQPLAKTETAELPPCFTTDNGRTLNSGGIPMARLAGWLRPVVGREVVDRTGLAGAYRFVLRYSRFDPGSPAPTDEYPEITTALREQLGLRLTPTKASVNVLVVDRFERPSDD